MGTYVENTLDGNEVVEFETKQHWIVFLPGIILLPVWGLGLPILILRAITRETSEFAVTSKKVVIKVGWISRKTIEMNLSKIESIDVDQGIFGRIFGYGTIVVVGTGASRQRFKTIASPLEFRRTVQRLQEP